MSDETGKSGVGSLEVPSSESAVHSKYSSGSTNGAGAGKKVVIKSADMKEDLQKEAIDIAIAAFEKYSVEKEVAEHIKKMFDKKHGPTWHCIVGKNFEGTRDCQIRDYWLLSCVISFPYNVLYTDFF